MFLFCSQTDTYGQVVVEAQASGLPVVAVDEGGPASLIGTATRPAVPAGPGGAGAAVAGWPPRRAAPAARRRWRCRGARADLGARAGQLADGYARALARAPAPSTTPVGPTDLRPLTPIAGGRRAA